jgi:hypothetical protein
MASWYRLFLYASFPRRRASSAKEKEEEEGEVEEEVFLSPSSSSVIFRTRAMYDVVYPSARANVMTLFFSSFLRFSPFLQIFGVFRAFFFLEIETLNNSRGVLSDETLSFEIIYTHA